MRIVAFRTLKAFWEMPEHHRSEKPLRAWFKIVRQAEWNGPQDVKDMFGANVDFVGDNRIIFDIGGNKYRLVVHVAYLYKSVLIKFVGTHKQYDHIDPETV